MEDLSPPPLHTVTHAGHAMPCMPPAHARSVLDDCVDEFTRNLQACVALPEDDEHFWNRIRVELGRLRARCQPQDAFAFELKAARVLAEYGLTTWPAGLMGSSLSTGTPQDAPRRFDLDMQTIGGSGGTRAA